MSERMIFATQGNEYSWHAEAARTAAGTPDIGILDCNEFSEVITASIDESPGMGVMAINTARGTVAGSARKMVGRRAAALPQVVARVDLEIGLSLIGSVAQSLEELNRPGVHCYLQEEAQLQIDAFKREHLPALHYERRRESTHAVLEALGRKSRDHVAIGPSYSARRIGGHIIGPRQINPQGSITSFYIFQRDPRMQNLPVDPASTTRVSVLGFNYPDEPGEFEKCVDAMDKVGVDLVRYIPYRTGHPTRHNPNVKKNGGILEVQHDIYDSRVTKLCAKINALTGRDDVYGPFDAKKLGGFDWVEQEIIDLGTLAA